MDKREQAGWVRTADFDTLDLSVARGNPRFGICAHLYNTGLTPGRCCPANGRGAACKKAPEGACVIEPGGWRSVDAQHDQGLVEQLVANLAESDRAIQLADLLAFQAAEQEDCRQAERHRNHGPLVGTFVFILMQ